MRDPEPLSTCDVLIMESTYGGKLHQRIGQVADKLAEVVNHAARRGGKYVRDAEESKIPKDPRNCVLITGFQAEHTLGRN